jgi:hypothetical protein
MEAERDALFSEVLAEALTNPEAQEGLRQQRALSAEDLRKAAGDRRAQLLGEVRGPEEEYRQASTAVRAQHSRRRAEDAAWIGGAAVLVLLLVGYPIASTWDAELKKAYGASPHHHLGVWTVVAGGLEYLAVLVIAGGIIGPVAFAAGYLISAWRSGKSRQGQEAREKAREKAGYIALMVAVAAPVVVIGLTITSSSGGVVSQLVWQLSHGRPAAGLSGDISHFGEGVPPAYGWARLVGWAVGLMILVAVLSVIWGLVLPNARSLSGSSAAEKFSLPSGPAVVAAKRDVWRSALSEVVLSFLRGQISDRVVRRYATVLEPPGGRHGLRQVRTATHVQTRSSKELADAANGMAEGSIALSGPRGIGKTDLLRAFCVNPQEGRYGLVVNAPVVFDRREFMLHLLGEACDLVIDRQKYPSTPFLGKEAEDLAHGLKEGVHYLEARSEELSASAGWMAFGLAGKRGISKARQPLTYPEIVSSLRTFLQTIAIGIQAKDGLLVIGIDELDRIEPPERARDFLNELKVVFDVSGCLFVLSMSDEALREAGLAQPGRRDAFDSAIDEVIRVKPLTYKDAVQLINSRAIWMPEPFTALFHCLSGGLPRDLLRIARAAVAYASTGQPRSLSEVTAYLTERDLHRRPERNEPSGYKRFRATLLDVFTDTLTKEQLDQAEDRAFPGSFDALASEYHRLADPAATGNGLPLIRQAWGLPDDGNPATRHNQPPPAATRPGHDS